MSEQQAPSATIVDKLQKLLRLARDGGATESEANVAMEMAQRIARTHNLSIAAVELEGGSTGEEGKRVKDEASGEGRRSWAQYRWQRDLMQEIAEINFCHCSLKWGRKEAWRKGSYGKARVVGYNLIGRQSNVVSAKEMFVYLITTINRLLLDHNMGDASQNMSKYSNSWKEGCADRLRERLRERHERALAEQKREAEERKARSQHPAAAPTSNALTIVLSDYAQDEVDLNYDMRMGWEPGTTKRRRAEREAHQKVAEVQHHKEIIEAQANGASERELDLMRTYGVSLAEARRLIEQWDAPDTRTEAQKRKAQEKEERENARWYRKERARLWREADRIDRRGYEAGQSAADKVGLDKQVDHNPMKRL